MKVLKILGIIIFILIAIFLIVPAFISDSGEISRTIEIEASPQVVFRQVNSTANYIKWSPFEADPTMVNTFEGPEQGIGATRHWDGEEAKSGTMTIVESVPYSKIVNKLTFGEDDGGGFGTWDFTDTDGGTKVTWAVTVNNMSYLEKWGGLLMPYFMGPMLEQGLNELKILAESLPIPPQIKIVEMDLQPALVVSDSTTMEGMPDMFERSYTKLMTYVKKAQIPITGVRFAVYHDWNPEGYTHISCGIPVAEGSKGKGDVKYFELPSGKTVFGQHKGGYNSAPVHYAIDDYMKDFGLEMDNFIWEAYGYDPRTDTDSTNWVTMIYYPVK